MEKDFHIGDIIRQKLQEQERSGAWLARKLYTDPSNMSKLLKRKHLDAGLLLHISLILGENLFNYYSDAKIFIAHFIPSTAALIIPPAYPAPSPHGYNPFTFDINSSFLKILTGEELLVSTPVSNAFLSAKPLSFLSK
jgi:hypothetical protein